MNQIKKITNRATTVAMEAGVFFMSLAVPAFAQDLSLTGGADQAQGTEQPGDLFGQTGIFRTITNILLFLVGAISVIMLIFGGFKYVVSGGDSNSVESAKNTILYAIVGIVVAFLAYAAVNFVLSSLQQNV